jgi:hypothetical protein
MFLFVGYRCKLVIAEESRNWGYWEREWLCFFLGFLSVYRRVIHLLSDGGQGIIELLKYSRFLKLSLLGYFYYIALP